MESKIEAIPKTMEKFFGCSGDMVKPSVEVVKKFVLAVGEGKLITLEALREALAKEFNVQTACPAATTKAITLLAKEDNPVAYWRVVKKNGELFKQIPGGTEAHAFLLEKEGFEVNSQVKRPKLMNYEDKLTFLC